MLTPEIERLAVLADRVIHEARKLASTYHNGGRTPDDDEMHQLWAAVYRLHVAVGGCEACYNAGEVNGGPCRRCTGNVEETR